MTPPAVTIVAHDVGPVGGMERQLEQLTTGLLEAGCKLTLISRTCLLPPHNQLRWVRIPGPSRPFPLAFLWFYVLGSLAAASRRRGLLHSTGALIGNRVDLTTVHFCHRAARQLGRLSRRRRTTPAYALNAWFSSVIREITEGWSYRRSRVRSVVGVSVGLTREVRRCYPGISHIVETIPNAVDLDEFRPDAGRRAAVRAALGLPDAALAAVFVGSEWERKGLAPAIAAVARRPDWHLVVVGSGHRAQYDQQLADMGCAHRVHFVGAVNDVSAYYAAGDAFVLPTRYETFSMVSFEAAASGLPLLVTRVSGVEDVLQDGVNGWFIEPDAHTIETRLEALGRDAGLRARMGLEARAAARRFDWPSVVSAYCALYARLDNGVGGRTGRSPQHRDHPSPQPAHVLHGQNEVPP